MALEGFIGKYIDDLVTANPVGGSDPKSQGDDHIRGIKLVLQNSFPQISGTMNCTETELNYLDGVSPGNNLASKAPVLDGSKDLVLGAGDVRCTDVIPSGNLYQGGTKITASAAEINQLDGDVGVLNQAGDIVLFYMAAAPTGWTQDKTTTGLAGSTLRVETGAGGGAVVGTHDINSPPSIDHNHSDTFYNAGTAINVNDLPAHYHFIASGRATSNSSPALGTTESLNSDNASGNNDNYDLEGSDAATYPATQGRSSETGANSTHTHSLLGAVSTKTLTAFAPKHINMILCTKD